MATVIDFSRKNQDFAFIISLTPKDDPTELTCWSKNEIKEGDIVRVSDMFSRPVIRVIERTNCKGNFKNPEDKINTFYKLKI